MNASGVQAAEVKKRKRVIFEDDSSCSQTEQLLFNSVDSNNNIRKEASKMPVIEIASQSSEDNAEEVADEDCPYAAVVWPIAPYFRLLFV